MHREPLCEMFRGVKGSGLRIRRGMTTWEADMRFTGQKRVALFQTCEGGEGSRGFSGLAATQ